MKRILRIAQLAIINLSIFILIYSSIRFLHFNNQIIKHPLLFGIIIFIPLTLLFISNFIQQSSTSKRRIVFFIITGILSILFIMRTVLYSVLLDYFQPLSLYDEIIYLSIVAFVLFILFIATRIIVTVVKKELFLRDALSLVSILVFILCFYALAAFQGDHNWSNINNSPIHVFSSNEEGYKIFRIPALLVIPKGSHLANGEIINNDHLLAFSEARRNGSPDFGDIDIVQKTSTDAGKTWANFFVTQEFEPGIGKVGNPTPLFIESTGEVLLCFISANVAGDYSIYSVKSQDGGASWNSPTYITKGVVGPGHGINIKSGNFSGRLIIPMYSDGFSKVLISDDAGETWTISENAGEGNECQAVEIANKDQLLLIFRVNTSVASSHEPLQKMYATSLDGGMSWNAPNNFEAIKEPICMSSIVELNSQLFYSHPDDYFSRVNMTIAKTDSNYLNWNNRYLIYDGPSGYSDLGVSANNSVYLLFENGTLEYDQRISFIEFKIPE